MQRCAFTPYEGKKPYMFISYAHKDSHLVFPILEELDRRGYRVWYDDGIAPGSEWPENIAQHLDGCSLTVAFISPNSIASANCRREVTFALSKRKPFLGIMLQETEMSLGMEMQLSAQQCIMKYTYASDEAFISKVCSCPDLEPCLGQPKAQPVAPAAQEVTPAPTVVPEKPAPKPPKEKKPAAKKPVEKKPVDKKLIGIIAGAVAAVAVLAIVLGIALGGRGEKDPNPSASQNGETGTPTNPDAFTGETVLCYVDQTITAEDVSYINRQTKLESLELRNCVIEDEALNFLELPGTVTGVCLDSCTGLSNLYAFLSLENLVSLKLISCDIYDGDLFELPSQKLQEVDISGNPHFTDLSVFAASTGITSLRFADTGVSSLAPLAAMENLLVVDGSRTQVKDLTVVAEMTGLREVSFAGCGIETIETPFYSLYLETLDMSYNALNYAEAFTYCTVLKHVNLAYNELYDVDELEKSVATLETLSLGGNDSLYSSDLEILSGCTKLRWLMLDGLYLSDLSFLSEMVGLEYLSAVDCSIRDISPLQKLVNLQYLNLACNRFSDISVLADVANEGMILDLSFNDYLEDVSALPAMRYTYLNLTNGDLDPYTVPAAYGDVLLIAYNEGWLDGNCMNEADREVFGQIVMIACPLDKVVATENRFGKDRLCFIEELEDYLALLEESGIDTYWLAIALS